MKRSRNLTYSRLFLPILLSILHPTSALSDDGSYTTHGISSFGDLKYEKNFEHFDYVTPNAPKGGTVKIRNLNSFDSINPFILKGVYELINADKGGDLSFNFTSLMTRAHDEPDAIYPLLAKEVTRDRDDKWVEFRLRTDAVFHDGTPIRVSDVAFTFRTLKNDGHPRYRLAYEDILPPIITGPNSIRFDFKDGALTRGLALTLGKMPILSEKHFETRNFNETTLEPILGSGPYRIVDVQPGRSVTYERVINHWAEKLPVHVGRYNFDRIQVDYYRDRSIALEAFFAGEYDFREEYTSKSWATEYSDKPAFKKGLIKKEVLNDASLTGYQAFFFNTRLEKFSDIRVRAALARMFDFEWTNKNLFYNSYQRLTSIFENSLMKASGKPSEAELALLEPWRDQIPDQVFKEPFQPFQTSGNGNIRTAMRQSLKELKEAGWSIQNKKLVNAAGEQMSLEFLIYSKSFERIINPFIRNLERIGVDARIRLVDVASWQNRMQNFDFEIATRRFSQPAFPGVELRNWWHSNSADTIGGLNIAGVKNPAIDSLVEKIIAANSKDELITAARALDRILMHSHYTIPQWYKASHFIAYWDKFSKPSANKPGYDRAMLDTWWYDPAKAARIAEIQSK
ncbi:extracellular solute-binding protein [Sneathiella glossodoripedis]|uniref:extracellular solute-binding protein n=1 Tax=Sneathiella glossodoripedis TaxID=418853 RepID=UPI00046E92C3|nr:extracellular solute-binding protein [Sneathiella glossodoripedis]